MTDDEIRRLPNDQLREEIATLMGWKNLATEFVPGLGCPGQDMLVGVVPETERRECVPDFLWDATSWTELLCDVRGDTDPPRLLCILAGGAGEYIVTLSGPERAYSGAGMTIGEAVCRACLSARNHMATK